MFSDRFEQLCKLKDVKPGRACKDMGVSRSLAAKWKSTGTERPSTDVLEKMSKYFRLSIDEILNADLSSEEIKHKMNWISSRFMTRYDDSGYFYEVKTRTSNSDIDDVGLRFALYGDPAEDITEEDLAQIRDYARYVREKKNAGK